MQIMSSLLSSYWLYMINDVFYIQNQYVTYTCWVSQYWKIILKHECIKIYKNVFRCIQQHQNSLKCIQINKNLPNVRKCIQVFCSWRLLQKCNCIWAYMTAVFSVIPRPPEMVFMHIRETLAFKTCTAFFWALQYLYGITYHTATLHHVLYVFWCDHCEEGSTKSRQL